MEEKTVTEQVEEELFCLLGDVVYGKPLECFEKIIGLVKNLEVKIQAKPVVEAICDE